ncbi:MAG: Uma2 family endonuclease [Acidobacteriota bacterium]|nr:MAG: Uma2 family endonuclease [Acidobacteriota bacterium]
MVLHDVSWETYARLLEDCVDSSTPRLTYDKGTLEITSPTAQHEELNRTLALLVEILALELGLDIRSLGSTTFRREDLERGFDPDSCFYVRNARAVQGQVVQEKTRLDPAFDPPPDLVIEIDITSPSVRKDPIYAELGVPEVWRYNGGELRMSKLEENAYVTCENSVAFPLLTARDLSEFLQKSRTTTRPELVESFRQ